MLSKYDEFMCHQIESTFDHQYTSAREWTERIILHFGETSGKFHLSHGFGIYPNRNVMDAFACFNLGNKTQYTVRASRELRPCPDEVKAGPFSYHIVEPLKKVRCCLDDNEYGLSFDLEFTGVLPPSEEDPQFTRYKGRVVENVPRYVQPGRGKGWIKYDGKKMQVDRKTCFVSRDHSWGIRRTGAMPELMVEPSESRIGSLYSWGVFQFKKWAAAYHIREGWDGKQTVTSGSIFFPEGSGKEEIRITGVEHDFKFLPGMRKVSSGMVTLTGEDGSKKKISFKTLNYALLRTGGYFEFNGFQHGQWMGPEWSDGFKLDLTNPKVLKEASLLDDESCEVRCGNEKGYGHFEQVTRGKSRQYGFKQ